MRRATRVLVMALVLGGAAIAAETRPRIAPFSGGQYMIHGGDLGDVSAPGPGDAKLYLELSGEAARRIFEQLGRASEKKRCAEPGEVVRTRGGIACTRSRGGGHVCQMGYDLTTGRAASASIC